MALLAALCRNYAERFVYNSGISKVEAFAYLANLLVAFIGAPLLLLAGYFKACVLWIP